MQPSRVGHCLTRIVRRGFQAWFKGEKQCNKIRTFSCHVHSPRIAGLPKVYQTLLNGNVMNKNSGLFYSSSSSLTDSDIKKAIESLSDQFIEARELLDDARESFGTVYFSEDMKEAQAAVEETLKFYENLLSQLSSEQRQVVLQSVGLKMEELKAQEQAIKEQLHDD